MNMENKLIQRMNLSISTTNSNISYTISKMYRKSVTSYTFNINNLENYLTFNLYSLLQLLSNLIRSNTL